MKTGNIQATGTRRIGGLSVSVGSRHLRVPIYQARRLSLDGRNITPQVRGAFDGHAIVLTKYGTRRTLRHEVSHAIDFTKSGRISEKGARSIGFSLRGPLKRRIADFYLGRHFHLTEEHARIHGHSEQEIQEHLASGREKGYSDVKYPSAFHRETDREEFRRRTARQRQQAVGFAFVRPHPVGCRCPFHLGHKGKYRLSIRR